MVGVLRARSSLSTVTDIVLAATDRLGFNADGALLDANGLVIANTLNDSWLLRPAVALAPAVEAALAQRIGVGSERRRAASAGRYASSRASSASNSRPCLTGRTTGAYYHALAMPLTQTDWTYVAALPFDTFQAAARTSCDLAVIAALVGIGVAFAAGALVAQHLVQAAAAPDEREQTHGGLSTVERAGHLSDGDSRTTTR